MPTLKPIASALLLALLLAGCTKRAAPPAQQAAQPEKPCGCSKGR